MGIEMDGRLKHILANWMQKLAGAMKPISSNTAKTEFGSGATSTFKESIQKLNYLLRLCNSFIIESILDFFLINKEFDCEKGADMV